jgi:Phytanoyl-CoA dioxygenase (PhyH)
MPPLRLPAENTRAHWDRNGFAVLPAYLDARDLRAGVAELSLLFPTAAEFADDADPARNAPYRDDEYGGLRTFPFASVELSLLAVHPSLVALARTLLRTDDVRIYSAEAWAKYTGAARYEQSHHRDFLNHTVTVPSDDPAYRNLELFVFLHAVSEELGPTHVVSTTRTEDLALLPHVTTRAERPELYDAEVSAAGPAGTVLAYRGETVHRATELTRPGGARYTLHCSFRPAADEWVGRQGWGDRSYDSWWEPFVNRASVEQLALFGFPPPGHPFWTPHTLAALEVRYAGLDTSPWRADTARSEV